MRLYCALFNIIADDDLYFPIHKFLGLIFFILHSSVSCFLHHLCSPHPSYSPFPLPCVSHRLSPSPSWSPQFSPLLAQAHMFCFSHILYNLREKPSPLFFDPDLSLKRRTQPSKLIFWFPAQWWLPFKLTRQTARRRDGQTDKQAGDKQGWSFSDVD